MTTIMNQPPQDHQTYDRKKEVHEFEETKLGVKGLVDSGITELPRIFHHPPENRIPVPDLNSDSDSDPIPVIDLLGTPREEAVEKVKEACTKYGFFQIVNHGVPVSLLRRLVDAIKAFHEQPAEVRKEYYDRGTSTGCNYFSNVDLFVSKAASWRDTLQMRLGPSIIDVEAIPAICRNEILEWDKEVKQLGELLLGLFSEGLGTSIDRLKELSCLESRVMVGHYYPHCPEPEKTVGITSHADPVIFTALLQDQVGGLQVKHEDKWVDVKPIPGALVINVGDLLQIISNGKYNSVDHRVYANPLQDPRVSIAVFFNPGNREDTYGPLPELVSPEEPALYQEFKLSEFLTRFFTKELDGKSLVNFFRLKSE
ncbi:1-aminocyclopropane-1-carboxylate oxidase homolog 4-like [Silene latifolia]|uniref:1-aminocyclopropane-1-carboxylate oxidase homolog 4-like n=1 Tax=Silene latifolia TaxID=37657 RepID=UPI003D77AF2A